MGFDPFIASAPLSEKYEYVGTPQTAPSTLPRISSPNALPRLSARTEVASVSGWTADARFFDHGDCYRIYVKDTVPSLDILWYVEGLVPYVGVVTSAVDVVDDVNYGKGASNAVIDLIGVIPLGKLFRLVKMGRIAKSYKGIKFLRRTGIPYKEFRAALLSGKTNKVIGIAEKAVTKAKSGYDLKMLKRALEESFERVEPAEKILTKARDWVGKGKNFKDGGQLFTQVIAEVDLALDRLAMCAFLAAFDTPFPKLVTSVDPPIIGFSPYLNAPPESWIVHKEVSAESTGWIDTGAGTSAICYVRKKVVDAALKKKGIDDWTSSRTIAALKLAMANITSAYFDWRDCVFDDLDPSTLFTGGARPSALLSVILKGTQGELAPYVVDTKPAPRATYDQA